MGYGGWIKDKQTGSPIPRATVEIYSNGNLFTRIIADNAGYWDGTGVTSADSIKISSAGYTAQTFPADTNKWLYELQRNVVTLPPVVLPPGGTGTGSNSKNMLLWLAIGLVIIAANQK